MTLTTSTCAPADLLGDAAVEILRRHQSDRAGGLRGRALREGEQRGECQAGERLHG